MSRTAVVVFNLGGPDSARAVQPFLFNLFSDPAIIALPNPLRWAIARLISWRRAPMARQIYARLGNASPLLANTELQAHALETALGVKYRVFIAMRYWHPVSRMTAAKVKAWAPDEVVLLPLYPQFSTTTTWSSLEDWHRAASAVGLAVPSRAVCCYPTEPGFVTAAADAIAAECRHWPVDEKLRILLSAHGLPRKIVASGDPYQWQVEQTAAAIRARLAQLGLPGLDVIVCYQSRVGPLQWIGPGTDDEVRRAGIEGVGLIVAPIAFVSEHSETLVELDIEYRHLADRMGVPRYVRVATVGTAPHFIAALAALVERTRGKGGEGPCPGTGQRICPASFGRCPCLAERESA